MSQNTYHPPSTTSTSGQQATGHLDSRLGDQQPASTSTSQPASSITAGQGTATGASGATGAAGFPGVTGTRTTGTTGPTETSKTTEAAAGVGHGLKAAVAGVHGVGEAIRGSATAAVDRVANEPEGVRRNEAIAREGEREVEQGEFRHTRDAGSRSGAGTATGTGTGRV
ncbi:hypothetical protein AJ79_10009 [Helicocarpus griseus UAMH5409]|uniref:Uncharacterized protein n=1 Tax=Helicocarpus griseus UAMH5409 TaxID=1447875 RepID=A0A2B7WG03_9EURO|nr:hypothetical protein AJ79_10009 [Helicocarpus griseus UAMH5409]